MSIIILPFRPEKAACDPRKCRRRRFLPVNSAIFLLQNRDQSRQYGSAVSSTRADIFPRQGTDTTMENTNMPRSKPTAPKSLAMIHTVAGLIPVFDSLARQEMPDWAAFNMLDESLLRGTIRDGSLSQLTMRRLLVLVWSAVDAGAGAVVVTCSSLGPAVDAAQPLCPVPLFRIDEGMAQAAVATGHRVGVLATLRTTLEPTAALITRTADRQGRACTITSRLAEGAFERLAQGDTAGHDRMVAKSLVDLAPTVDVIVLAQASMARALAGAGDALGALPVLTSPELGMKHIRACLAG